MNTFSLQNLKEIIIHNPKTKEIIHHCIFTNCRPRKWVKIFINPFAFHHGSGSVIRFSSILNVTPVKRFHIGNHSIIEEYTVVDNGVGDVLVGNNSLIGLRNTIIGPVTIGNNVIIAQNVVFSGLNHNYENINCPIQRQGVSTAPIKIKDECWIGANAVITAGVTVGKHSIIAAESVVTKDIPDYCIAAGNPASIIKKYNANTKNWERIQH